MGTRRTTSHGVSPRQRKERGSVEKKFNKLATVKMGTGDPTMPPDVHKAKEIRRLIIEKSEGVTGSEEEPFAIEDAN